ncbi:MAG: class I SAM-dependent methyltransferase [Myxococcales bacterium]|nr:class I SAM-dependent methyltransferase [Myxococcales bacterium]
MWGVVAGVYPGVLRRWPAVAETVGEASDGVSGAVAETLRAYDFQHVAMADAALPVDDWRATWDRFQPGGAPEGFGGQTVVEIGCGEGRHAALVGAHAARLVGLDLSLGVEVARRRDGRANVLYVQGDLHRAPLRRGAFDALYSNGVLHHTPDPGAAFLAVAPLVRAGGEVRVWVYGLEGMRWWYRASHLRWLRPVSGRLPRGAQVGLAAVGAAALEVGWWGPIRVAGRLGVAGAGRLPWAEAAGRPWRYKVRRVFDRLNPPVTHYLSRDELLRWFAGFEGVEVVDASGQGFAAWGRVPGSQR